MVIVAIEAQTPTTAQATYAQATIGLAPPASAPVYRFSIVPSHRGHGGAYAQASAAPGQTFPEDAQPLRQHRPTDVRGVHGLTTCPALLR